jgi:hypothetical protein
MSTNEVAKIKSGGSYGEATQSFDWLQLIMSLDQ